MVLFLFESQERVKFWFDSKVPFIFLLIQIKIMGFFSPLALIASHRCEGVCFFSLIFSLFSTAIFELKRVHLKQILLFQSRFKCNEFSPVRKDKDNMFFYFMPKHTERGLKGIRTIYQTR